MKKQYLLALLLVMFGFSAMSIAQTATKTTPAASTGLSEKAKALCKTWKFTGSENFSLEQPPADTQLNDQIILMEDGRFRWIMNGNPVVGTWTIDKANTWIVFTQDVSKEQFKIKVLESSATKLKVDYRDKDDVHNILIFLSAK